MGFASVLANAAKTARALMGVEITYRREGDEVKLTATIGSTKVEQEDGEGMVVERQVRDYLVATAELLLSGVKITPEINDLILEADGSDVHSYRVIPVGEEHWRWGDPARQTRRIHTQYVGTSPA